MLRTFPGRLIFRERVPVLEDVADFGRELLAIAKGKDNVLNPQVTFRDDKRNVREDPSLATDSDDVLVPVAIDPLLTEQRPTVSVPVRLGWSCCFVSTVESHFGAASSG